MAVTKGVRPKKVPMRQCMGCGEKKEKKDLIRIIRTPDEEIVLDVTGKKMEEVPIFVIRSLVFQRRERKKQLTGH